MPKFHLHDTVALVNDGAFVGSVDRTSQIEGEPLEECLIIRHTEVPADLLTVFLTTGSPPSGYVFVQFAKQEQGNALVSEDDLILVDRILDLGDVVKTDAYSLTGYVVNVSNTYVLDPVWRSISSEQFSAVPSHEQKPSVHHKCTVECNAMNSQLKHTDPARLICNVPFEELKRAADFIEGDYVIESDWLGVVDGYEMCVVLMLQDGSIVIVNDPNDLYIPVPDYKKDIVSLPELDDFRKPPFVSAMRGASQAVPPEELECGQFVVTDVKNLTKGRWLKGEYSPRTDPQGTILLVRCRRLDTRWLMCNAYTPCKPWECRRPDRTLPYENLTTFTEPQEIRRDSRLTIYDPSKRVSSTRNRTRNPLSRLKHVDKTGSSVNLSSTFTIGDQVKFRDQAGAAVKYQGTIIDGVQHNAFQRIMHQNTFGYDLNEFKVVHSRQIAHVRWQDGTVTEIPSTNLTRINLFEAELVPADLVVAREGMMMKVESLYEKEPQYVNHPLLPFNEMTFFERPHDLIPARVGVVQNVSPGERVAQIRWFEQPRIRITSAGNSLGGESRFGVISDTIEDVSLYEVMTFPGLTRRLRDIVVIPPTIASRTAITTIEEIEDDDLHEVHASITALSQISDTSAVTLLEWMQHNARQTVGRFGGTVVEDEQYKPHKSLDWVGEICELNLDGSVVIRINAGATSEDVFVEHDQILAFIDENPWNADLDYDEDPMELDEDIETDSILSAGTEEALEEQVLYEGGQRIDDDSGDENWESEDDEEEEVGDDEKDENRMSRTRSIAMDDAADTIDETEARNGTMEPGPISTKFSSLVNGLAETSSDTIQSSDLPTTTQAVNGTISIPTTTTAQPTDRLRAHLTTTAPPAFSILDSEPPADQHQPSSITAPSNPSFLKRLLREHRALSTSLPPGIYLRTYSSRLDLLRLLLIGPLNTPYELAPFIIDLFLPPNYPHVPPQAHFHSWTSGMGRINPNLYEEGKICLSLLGTWPGKTQTESWSDKSTLLQLVLSLQALVLVKTPFFNEAGFEGYEDMPGQGGYRLSSLQYSEKAFVMARGFVRSAVGRAPGGVEDIIAWEYLDHNHRNHHDNDEDQVADVSATAQGGLLSLVISRARSLMQISREHKKRKEEEEEEVLVSGDGKTGNPTTEFMLPLSRGALVMLDKTLRALEEVRRRENMREEVN